MAAKIGWTERNRLLSLEALMNELRQEYIQSLPAKLQRLQEYSAATDIDSLSNEFHKMKGTGKTYGIPEVSQLAIVAESKLGKHAQTQSVWLKQVINLLEKIHSSRCEGKEFDLASSPEYQRLTSS